jgi:hypothetical protein
VYDIESANVISTKTITSTKEIINSHTTSDNGNYFALDYYVGTLLKIYDKKGSMIMDLSQMSIVMPKLFNQSFRADS